MENDQLQNENDSANVVYCEPRDSQTSRREGRKFAELSSLMLSASKPPSIPRLLRGVRPQLSRREGALSYQPVHLHSGGPLAKLCAQLDLALVHQLIKLRTELDEEPRRVDDIWGCRLASAMEGSPRTADSQSKGAPTSLFT